MPMEYLAKRLGLTVLTVVFATFLCFVMLRLSPGDPAELILQKVFVGPEDYIADEDARQAIVRRFELDLPLYRQYGAWLTAALGGDLGYSFRTGQRVSAEIGLRLWPTVSLSLLAMGLSLMLTVACAAAAGLMKDPLVRKLVDMVVAASVAAPNFYLAIVLIIVFSVKLDVLPVSGYGSPAHFVLPVLTLGLTLFGYTTAILNDAVANVRQQGFILNARAKGLPGPTVFRRHILRNAMVPVAPYVALQLGYVLGGVVVVESVFSWPGIGNYLVTSIQTRDLPAIQACVGFIALAFSLSNLLADGCIRLLDPRARTAP
jgi:peptide/nickel transport system permease protein